MFYLVGLVPLPLGLLISIDYTPLGFIWEGLLLVSTNPSLRFTLIFLLLVSFGIFVLLSPLRIIVILRDGYETWGEAMEGFRSKVWGTKEGKRTVILMVTSYAIVFGIFLFMLLSATYLIPRNTFLIGALFLFEVIIILLSRRVR
ncbi:MAG: hypothetical protein ACETWM_00620 [Candidatus Lokiarchaeia archaeon]